MRRNDREDTGSVVTGDSDGEGNGRKKVNI